MSCTLAVAASRPSIDGNRSQGGHPAPCFSYVGIDAEYTAREPLDKRLQPCFQGLCLVDVASLADKFYTPANLADGERAYEEL